MNWLATVRGRAGYLATDHLMLFATGGVAIGRVDYSTNLQFSTNYYRASDTQNRWGWVIGLGAEYAMTNRLMAKIEYLHFDLGDVTLDTVDSRKIPSKYATSAEFTTRGDLVRVGLSYKLN